MVIIPVLDSYLGDMKAFRTREFCVFSPGVLMAQEQRSTQHIVERVVVEVQTNYRVTTQVTRSQWKEEPAGF